MPCFRRRAPSDRRADDASPAGMDGPFQQLGRPASSLGHAFCAKAAMTWLALHAAVEKCEKYDIYIYI